MPTSATLAPQLGHAAKALPSAVRRCAAASATADAFRLRADEAAPPPAGCVEGEGGAASGGRALLTKLQSVAWPGGVSACIVAVDAGAAAPSKRSTKPLGSGKLSPVTHAGAVARTVCAPRKAHVHR